MTQLTPTHVAVAVVAAGGLFEEAVKRGNTPAGLRLAKMAADCVDHTQPHPVLSMAYRDRDPSVSDAAFLADNLRFLEPVSPGNWPKRKVRTNEWGEFTRVMHGLDEFFYAKPASDREVARNRSALQQFVLQHLAVLHPEDQAAVRAAMLQS